MRKVLFTLLLFVVSLNTYSQDTDCYIQSNFEKIIEQDFALDVYNRYMNLWNFSINKPHKDVIEKYNKIGFEEWNYVKRRKQSLILFRPVQSDVSYLPIQNRFISVDVLNDTSNPAIYINVNNEGGHAYYTMLNILMCFDFHRIGKLEKYRSDDGLAMVAFKNGRSMTIWQYDKSRFMTIVIK